MAVLSLPLPELLRAWLPTLAIVAGVGVTLLYIHYPTLVSPLRKAFPHAPGSNFVLGHLPHFGHSSHDYLYECTQTIGKSFFVRLGRWPCLVTTELEFVKAVGMSQFKEFHDRPRPSAPNDHVQHLLWARGAYWKSVRNAIAPAFSTRNLAMFSSQMDEAAERLVARFAEAQEKGTDVDVYEFMGVMAMEVIGGTAFGVDLSEGSGERSKEFYRRASDLFLFSGTGTSINGLLRFLLPHPARLWHYVPYLRPSTRRFAASLEYIDKFGREQIVSRRANPDAASTTGFLQILLGARDHETGMELSDQDVVEECRLFMLAGFETTANALTYTLYLVAQHPEVEARLVNEIRALDDGRPLDYDAVQKYTYAYCVMQESLRLYPPGSAVFREAVEDTQLGGVPVPKGSVVYVPLYALHRDPTLFPDPLSFRPERFEEGSPFAPKDKYAHLPFGLGPHMCIGYRFALAEAVTTLIHIYKRFTLTLSPRTPVPLPLRLGITMTPKCPVLVQVAARKDATA